MPPPDTYYPEFEDGELLLSELPDDAPPCIREEAERRFQFVELLANFHATERPGDMLRHYNDARTMLRQVNGVTTDLTIRQAKWQILLRIHLAAIHVYLDQAWRAFRNTIGAYQAIQELARRGVLFEQGIWHWMWEKTMDLYGRLYPFAEERAVNNWRRGKSPLESSESDSVGSDINEEEDDWEEMGDEGDVKEDKKSAVEAPVLAPSSPPSSTTNNSRPSRKSLATSASFSTAVTSRLQTPQLAHSLVPEVIVKEATPASTPRSKGNKDSKE